MTGSPGARRVRRELGGAVLGTALAGGLALSAGGQPWATVTAGRRPPLPPVTDVLSGAEVAPLVPAAGLVLLAAAVALPAVRGALRTVVGAFTALAGGVLGWSGVNAMLGGIEGWPGSGSLAAFPVAGLTTDLRPGWPVLAVVAGLLATAAGGVVVGRGRGRPEVGRRYERPAGAAGTAGAPGPRNDEDRAAAAWQALDRGDDPTEAAPPAGGVERTSPAGRHDRHPPPERHGNPPALQ